MKITFGRISFEISNKKLSVIAIIIIAMGITFFVTGEISNTVTYKGWNTKLTPAVYQSWSSKEYVSITLFKADSSAKGFKEKSISLEDSSNFKIFCNFLKNSQYDHYWVK